MAPLAAAAAQRPGTIRAAWYRWKSLKLPWRRKWLVGYDLHGRTFWEFHNQITPGGRPRRIVQYPRGTHYSDVAFEPAWLQWLRQTRAAAPTVEEQQLELSRQSQLKQLALQADERWQRQTSFLDKPEDTGQVGPPLQSNSDAQRTGQIGSIEDSKAGQAWQRHNQRGGDAQQQQPQQQPQQHKQQNVPPPAKKGAPGEEWQPESWKPGNFKARAR